MTDRPFPLEETLLLHTRGGLALSLFRKHLSLEDDVSAFPKIWGVQSGYTTLHFCFFPKSPFLREEGSGLTLLCCLLKAPLDS